MREDLSSGPRRAERAFTAAAGSGTLDTMRLAPRASALAALLAAVGVLAGCSIPAPPGAAPLRYRDTVFGSFQGIDPDAAAGVIAGLGNHIARSTTIGTALVTEIAHETLTLASA